ncbi:hypothetical protein VNI00_018893 [Paramarasmius palmivorus]|uniref:DUF6589 domain-containing protein n=1 Tax=Paramarasmius palmivorus TaxID=297713 RepID=A0AAW0AVB0_9AGAR
MKIVHAPPEPQHEPEVDVENTSDSEMPPTRYLTPEPTYTSITVPQTPRRHSPGATFEHFTPSRHPVLSTPIHRANSEAPAASSPLSILETPQKPCGPGRPRTDNPVCNPHGIREFKKTDVEWLAMQAAKKQNEKARNEVDKAHNIWNSITQSTDDGGFGFKSMKQFFDSIFGTGTSDTTKAKITRFFDRYGAEVAEKIFKRSDKAFDKFLECPLWQERLRKEGQAIQDLLTWAPRTKINDLLKEFTMEKIEEDLRSEAPTLWSILTNISEKGTEARWNKEMVFTTICAMITMVRSQKANNFQLIIGLFLLGSGASKCETNVFAHARLSVSYTTVIEHINTLSEENLVIIRRVIEEFMCSLCWDNVNFAFRVESQCLNSKDHFDSGTTATLIVVHNPFTGLNTAPGDLPLSMNLEHTTSRIPISISPRSLLPSHDDLLTLEKCLLWQLKQAALEHKPEFHHLKPHFPSLPPDVHTEQIALHKTEQYPLSAMHEDKSSLDGTINVYNQLMRTLRMDDTKMNKHGILFVHGDLLTCTIVDKIQAARCNATAILASLMEIILCFGLFHCKMAGGLAVYGGKATSFRKPMTAGWQAKKATPWHQSHDLISILLPAHILDGFRIYCEADDFSKWAKSATIEQFDAVALRVFNNLFTSAAYHQVRKKVDVDTILYNSILYNRDTLLYWLLVKSIKAGNIGCVVLVLRVWMVMMHTPKTMPCYADAIFKTLEHLEQYPETVRKFFLHNWLVNLTGKPNGFKEVDLLQEHQNFWLKAVYNTKGVNRSWEWLSMISMCIYSLRETLKMIQQTFNIPMYGTRCTIPDMSKEIEKICDALKSEKVQEYVPQRPAN